MTLDLTEEFKLALPAGEYSSVKVVENSVGVMASRGVRATAYSERHRVDVFLKAIRVERQGAGQETALLTNAPRLARVEERLQLARQLKTPLVPIHSIGWIGAKTWLLVSMTPVMTLSSRIGVGADITLATNVLNSLGASKCSGWIHYDICPDNVGITKEGDVVFIDPESFLQLEDGGIDVSLGHHKPWRLSPQIRQLISGATDAKSAIIKHNAEVILLAAECCCGRFNGVELNAREIETWARFAPGEKAVVDFWRAVLVRAATGMPDDPIEVAAKLTELETRRLDAPGVAPIVQEVSQALMLSGQASADSPWGALAETRAAMRQRRLSSASLSVYSECLLANARKAPHERLWWIEALTLHLVFLLDPVKALAVAREALKHHPDDEHIKYDMRLAQRWPQ